MYLIIIIHNILCTSIHNFVCMLYSLWGVNMNIVSKRLYDLRIDNDLLQKDVANILQISQQYYSQYENGKRELPIRHLKTLALYYNVSSDYILGIKEK